MNLYAAVCSVMQCAVCMLYAVGCMQSYAAVCSVYAKYKICSVMHLDVRLVHRNEPVCSCMQCDAVDVNAIACILALHTCFVEPLLNSNKTLKKVGKNCLIFSVMQAYASAFCMHLYAPRLCMHMYAARRMQLGMQVYAAECNMVRNYPHYGKKLYLSRPTRRARDGA